jgi:mannonate dehydratase
VTAELQEGFRIVRRHTTTPLALGEVVNSIWDAHILITEQLIDYIRMTIVHSGGITHLKKVASLAELYHVRTGCHGATDLSPVSMAAALHFDIAINNFGIQEYIVHTKQTDEVFPHAYSFKDGFLYPGEGPGFGVDYDESLAAKFPYERAYLPVLRKEDGTLFNWQRIVIVCASGIPGLVPSVRRERRCAGRLIMLLLNLLALLVQLLNVLDHLLRALAG